MGAFACLAGKLPLFLTLTLSALLHEYAHAVAAGRYGYRLNEILLLPYGAVVQGDLSEISPREEIFVCASGPAFSGAVATAVLAIWWWFPDCYPYTEDIFRANVVLCLSNLLPVYPLDGGRIAGILWRKWFGEKRGKTLSEITGVLTAVGFAAWYAFQKDFFACAFYTTLPFGLVGGAKYDKMSFCHLESFARGVEEKRIAVSEHATVKQVLRYAEAGRYLLLDIYSQEGDYLATCTQGDLEKLFRERGLFAELCEMLPNGILLKKEKENGLICPIKSDIL